MSDILIVPLCPKLLFCLFRKKRNSCVFGKQTMLHKTWQRKQPFRFALWTQKDLLNVDPFFKCSFNFTLWWNLKVLPAKYDLKHYKTCRKWEENDFSLMLFSIWWTNTDVTNISGNCMWNEDARPFSNGCHRSDSFLIYESNAAKISNKRLTASASQQELAIWDKDFFAELLLKAHCHWWTSYPFHIPSILN